MKKSPNKLHIHSGFTLLEMLFAVIIFSFALVSLMGIAGRGLIASATAKDQLTAEFLAEEVLEVARNVRDTNYINGVVWMQGLDACKSPNICDVAYSAIGNSTLSQCPQEGCPTLHENNGVFRPYSIGGAITSFSRDITIEPIGAGTDEMRLKATVYWQQKSLTRSMVVTTYISNWQ